MRNRLCKYSTEFSIPYLQIFSLEVFSGVVLLVNTLISSEKEVYVAAKLFNKFQTFEGLSTFLMILQKKTAYLQDFKRK